MKRLMILSLSLTLSACIGGGTGSVSKSSSKSSRGENVQVARNVVNALCAGNGIEALELLTNSVSSPATTLMTAKTMELLNHPVRARALYAQAMRSGSNDMINIKCASARLIGPVSEVAGNRLVDLQKNLSELDMNFIPKQRLHEGLPAPKVKPKAKEAKKPTLKLKRDTQGMKMLALKVERPPSHHPEGSWYAHLSSYSSYDDAQKYIATWEKRYPALVRAVTIWQVDIASGYTWRLGVATDEWADADRLCVTIRSQGEYCRVMDRMAQ